MNFEDCLSSTPVLGRILGAAELPNTDWVDYEDGPKRIQDTSEGQRYQVWRMRVINNDISITAPNFPEQVVLSIRGITSACFTFDQNGRYLMAYTAGTTLTLYWYDFFIEAYKHTLISEGVTGVRMTMDDKRDTQTDVSNIVLAYVREGNLYMRVQKDRYGIEYLVQEGIKGRLLKLGMTTRYRFQFLFEQNPFPVYEDPWPYGAI